MASRAQITITVTSSRGASTVAVSTNGRYISMPANTINYQLAGQPIQPTSSAEAFWSSVLALVSPTVSQH